MLGYDESQARISLILVDIAITVALQTIYIWAHKKQSVYLITINRYDNKVNLQLLKFDELPPHPGGVRFNEATLYRLHERDTITQFEIGNHVTGLLVELGASVGDTGEIIYELASELPSRSKARAWFTRGAALAQDRKSTT